MLLDLRKLMTGPREDIVDYLECRSVDRFRADMAYTIIKYGSEMRKKVNYKLINTIKSKPESKGEIE